MRLRTVLLPILAGSGLAHAAAAQAPGAPPRAITLDEALRQARRSSPAVIQAQGQIRAATATRRSAYAAFIPNVSLNASTTQQSPAGTPRQTPGGDIVAARWVQSQSLSANLELFSGFRRFADLRAARAQLEAAETGEVGQAAQVSLQVKQQYYASLAALENEVAAAAQLEEAEQQLRAARARVQARTATLSDSLRARIQVGNAQLALLTARTSRQAADASLGRFVGSDEPVTASTSDTARTLALPTLAVDSAAIAALAEDGPAIRQARANVAAARAQRRAARAPYLPTLTASYGRNMNEISPGFSVFPGDPSFTGSFRLALNYPLFNQYTREETLIRAEVSEAAAEAQLRDAQLAARQGLVQFLGQLRTAEQRVAIQREAVTAAQEDLRIQRQRYELGASTVLDVLTSQTQLATARQALIQARLDARLAQAQLEAIVGRDLGTGAP